MLIQRRDTPLVLAATRCAIVLAEVRGWSVATTTALFYGLKAVLDGPTGDDPVPLSQVRQRCGHRLSTGGDRASRTSDSGGCTVDLLLTRREH
jgi:hypothetical protein